LEGSYSKPENTTYRLYDLNTGKIVWQETNSYADDRRMKFFDNYMIFGNGIANEYIYKMETDGTYKKINESITNEEREENKELIRQAAKEKNLENVFRLYTGYIEGYDWHIAVIDIDSLIKNLPGNMRIRLSNNIWEKGNDWIDELKKNNIESYEKGYYGSVTELLNKDRVNPFREREWLFSIDLIAKDQEHYAGLYNAVKNQWAIPPIKADTFSSFLMTQSEDWVSYGDDFYNIKTREKNKNIYRMFRKNDIDYRVIYEGIMTYMGYYNDISYQEEKPIIEKF